VTRDMNTISFIGSVYSNDSINMNNYDVDSKSYVLTENVDYVYMGLDKPFSSIFVNVISNTTPGALSWEYYNGSTWISVDVTDESLDMSRSGFVQWEPKEDWNLVVVDGLEKYFVRFTGNIDVLLSGINMLFSNDNDLKETYRSINDYLGEDSSFVASHQSARNDLIQDIRNSGSTKISSITHRVDDINVWDFLKPYQLRAASKYLCLSKIFAGVSDNEDGKFMGLSKSYMDAYKNALDTFITTIDVNDDGKDSLVDDYESISRTRIKFV